ncbi:MAG: glycosyltransferase [Desulfobulbaceae bacterium]|nr:glycosyltransferase [Desulfobulbaceae bacterium]HIJ91202.1 glycosyltransferase [Deltaproteobacteria bacterium]
MKVLHVINGEFYAGAERVQDLLALCLPALGYEVGFACMKARDFPGNRIARDTPLYDIPMRSRYDLLVAVKLAQLIRQEKYRLVHTHTPRSAMVGRLASFLAGVPMVHHVHSPTIQDTENKVRNAINAFAEKATLIGVPFLVAVSGSISSYLHGLGYDGSRVRLVPNGVPAGGGYEHRAPGKDGSPWVLGCIGFFRPRKGLEVLIKAAGRLRKVNKAPAFVLRMVGGFETPQYEAKVKELAASEGVLDAIDWVGVSSDVYAELARMDLFVLPSLFGEGLPMVVLEAMANGVPVVASNIDGVPEAVRHGREGVLCPPGNERELAEALAVFLSGRHDWAVMSRNCTMRHRERYSDFRMAEGVAAVYADVMNSCREKNRP